MCLPSLNGLPYHDEGFLKILDAVSWLEGTEIQLEPIAGGSLADGKAQWPFGR